MKKKITKTLILFYSSIALGIALLLTALLLGDGDPIYYWGVLAVVPFAVAALFLHVRIKTLKRLKQLQEDWGKYQKRRRNFNEIAYYFRVNTPAPDTALIDDHTWTDLNMNDIFALLDRTLTGPGESVLYNLLRNPCTGDSKHTLEHRDQLFSYFQVNQREREELQTALQAMSDRDNGLTRLLWDQLPDKNPWSLLYSLLALVALLAVAAPFFFGSQGFLLLVLAFSVNSMIHYRVSAGFSFRIPTITNLATLLRTAKRISKLKIPILTQEQEELAQATQRVSMIRKKTRNLLVGSMNSSEIFLVIQYLKVLFLVEVRSFYGVLEDIKTLNQELRTIYALVGFLDSVQAIASYRESLEFTKPQFTSGTCLKVEGIKHPLLKNPTPNTINIEEQGILITGSNMAGKSTFLRTLGVNVVLAQTIYTCLAANYNASFLQVTSSINKLDDISQQKSLYYAEAERLLNIIKPAYSDLPALCLIDELLSGTNYTERVAASEAILDYLSKKNTLVVAATHDLDLADKLKNSYQCYHFTDKVDKNNLAFDYTLKPGVATTRNAIKLLDHLGYPQEIISQAQDHTA